MELRDNVKPNFKKKNLFLLNFYNQIEFMVKKDFKLLQLLLDFKMVLIKQFWNAFF